MKNPQRYVQRRPSITAMQFTGDNFKDLKKWVKDVVPDARVISDASSDAADAVPDYARIIIGRGTPMAVEVGISVGDWLVRAAPGPGDAPFRTMANDELVAVFEPDATASAATVRA